MSTRSSILDHAPKAMASLLAGRNLWGLADQLLISFTNFVTMILVAKGLHDKAAFGTFTLIYSALLFANIIQFALVTQPHNVIGATRTGEDYAVYTTATGLLQLIIALALGLIALIVAVGAGLAHASFTGQLIALVPSIVAWQLQEFMRRVLYTEGRLASAFANDLLSYGGQTVLMAIFWWHVDLNGEHALWSLAITSGAACIMGFFQIRHSLRWHISKQAILENWHFGKWLLGSEILQWCSSLQMYLYIAALILGTAASGTLRAAQILFGPARVFSFLLQSLLPIRFSRALAAEGEQALGSQMQKAALMVVILLGPYCVVMALFPKLVLSLVFDSSYAENPYVLSLYALQAMFSYLMLVLAAAFSAMRLTREIFYSSIFSGIVTLLFSWPLIQLLGVGGTIACMMLSTVAMGGFLVVRYRARHRKINGAVPTLRILAKEQPCPS